MNKILVVEDDRANALSIEEILGSKYGIILAQTAKAAWDGLHKSKPNLLLLDLHLPDIDGYELCRAIKNDNIVSHIPIIMLTGVSSKEGEAYGLSIGADDYIEKPYNVDNLIARVEVQLRKCKENDDKREILEVDMIRMDRTSKTVIIEEKEVILANQEFELLWLLIRNKGRIVSENTILRVVHGVKVVNHDNKRVDVNLHRLKEKIGKKVSRNIINISGKGYMYKTP